MKPIRDREKQLHKWIQEVYICVQGDNPLLVNFLIVAQKYKVPFSSKLRFLEFCLVWLSQRIFIKAHLPKLISSINPAEFQQNILFWKPSCENRLQLQFGWGKIFVECIWMSIFFSSQNFGQRQWTPLIHLLSACDCKPPWSPMELDMFGGGVRRNLAWNRKSEKSLWGLVARPVLPRREATGRWHNTWWRQYVSETKPRAWTSWILFWKIEVGFCVFEQGTQQLWSVDFYVFCFCCPNVWLLMKELVLARTNLSGSPPPRKMLILIGPCPLTLSPCKLVIVQHRSARRTVTLHPSLHRNLLWNPGDGWSWLQGCQAFWKKI